MSEVPRRHFLVALGGAVAAPLTFASAAVAHGRRRRVTVYVAGDSTAATWPADTAPKAGWGQALPPFLDSRRVDVDNEALSGASSKSFVEVGLLDKILATIGPGDYLLISFGHNDEKTDDRHTDPFTTYQQYLSMYIDGARRTARTRYWSPRSSGAGSTRPATPPRAMATIPGRCGNWARPCGYR